MRRVSLLLAKDLRIFGRSPGVVAALILYPLIVAVIVGLVVRYAGDRPRIALVDEDGLPAVLDVGGQKFDVQQVFDRAAEDVELVRLSREEADRRLANGELLGIVVIPEGFERDLRGMVRAPEVSLRTTESGLATRVLEKVQALVYVVNRQLQDAYIDANLEYVNLLKDGGSGAFLGDDFDVMGLAEAERRLDALAESPDPEVRSEAEELANFVRQARLALEATDESLRATANPIELVQEERGGRAIILSAEVQAYALALTLGFVGLIVAAAGIASERDENVFGRLTRGLSRPLLRLSELVGEKIAFVAVVGGAIGLLLAVVFGLVVELGNAAGGEPWQRLPIVLVGVVLGAAAFGALGVVIGALAREARAATLLAFLVALPIMLLGLVPSSIVPAAGAISQAFPFSHTVDLLSAALADADPAVEVLREAGWLIGLGVAFAVLARVAVRRLAT
jgi:ABC-2 type transport system permease protein